MNKYLLTILACTMAAITYASEPQAVLLDTVYVDLPPYNIKNGKQYPVKVDGGELFFVPDSLAGDIEKVLTGQSKIVHNDDVIDKNEMVIVGNDTVPLFIKERNLGRYDRGLLNYLFVPKGKWMFGMTASYGNFDAADVQILDLMTDLDFKGHAFSVKPYISYFIRNNLSVGMRFVYSNAKAELGSLQMDIDEDMDFHISDANYRNESYSASFFVRQYIGLGRNSRFGVFNEMELSFASGNANFVRKYDNEPKNTRTTYMDTRINFSPGLTMFMMKNVSFNISFGVFGFYMRNEKQRTNGKDDYEDGNRFTSGASFKFNIFNINFGLGIHL